MNSTASETGRLNSLRGYRILDTPGEPMFDAITSAAAKRFAAPIALISLVDEHRQWFKSRVGLDALETPRAVSFCSYAILNTEVMVVPDATCDARFVNNPLVLNDPSIRFYAGAVLKTPTNQRLGTLCVIDNVPRADLSDEEKQDLQSLADKVMRALEERKVAIEG